MREHMIEQHRKQVAQWDSWNTTSVASVANQTSNLQSLMLSDLVTGSGNRPPKLLNMNDFRDWKDRIQTHMEGMEGGVWEAVKKRYVKPINETTGLEASYHDLTEPLKKEQRAKKKAQALSPEILHQFSQYKNSYDLWLNMCIKFEGDASMTELRLEKLKKEFENFNYIGNESLTQMSARFHHLIAEMEDLDRQGLQLNT